MIMSQTVNIIVSYASLVFAYFIVSTLVGALTAWLHDKIGDSTAKDLGYMTLNPIDHFNPMLLVFSLLFGFPFQMPLPTNALNLSYPYRTLKIVLLYGSRAIANVFALFITMFFWLFITIYFGAFFDASLFKVFNQIFQLTQRSCLFYVLLGMIYSAVYLLLDFIESKSGNRYHDNLLVTLGIPLLILLAFRSEIELAQNFLIRFVYYTISLLPIF